MSVYLSLLGRIDGLPFAREPLMRWLLMLLVLSGSCSDFPRDPRETLERARGGTLRVGVTEAFPWVIRQGDEAVGVEPELVRKFASSIDAEIEWIWGSAEEHYTALEHYDLHLAATGATRDSPWSKHVAFSQPYHTSEVVIARPPSVPPPEELDGLKVVVPDRGPLAGWVRDHDGEPVPSRDLESSDSLVAIEDWRLGDSLLVRTAIVIHRHEHVLAAPPGENAFLMALENSNHGVPIAPLIERACQFEKPDRTHEASQQEPR